MLFICNLFPSSSVNTPTSSSAQLTSGQQCGRFSVQQLPSQPAASSHHTLAPGGVQPLVVLGRGTGLLKMLDSVAHMVRVQEGQQADWPRLLWRLLPEVPPQPWSGPQETPDHPPTYKTTKCCFNHYSFHQAVWFSSVQLFLHFYFQELFQKPTHLQPPHHR